MATQVQNRRGTTAEHSTFTGANGELTVDTTKRTLVVHDGATAGGRPLLREDQSNLPTSAPTTGIYNASGSLAISTGGSGRLFVDASGRLGIGTSAPDYLLTVGSGSGVSVSPTAIRLDNTFTGSPATKDKLKFYLYKDANEAYGLTVGDAGDLQYWAGGSSNGIHRWFTSGSERARIDSSGRLLVGTSTTSESTTMVVQGKPGDANGAGTIFLQGNYSGDADALYGEISFKSAEGILARISGVGDLNHSGDAPGRLVFSTTADGASSPTERLRITSAGKILYNTATAAANTAITITAFDNSVGGAAVELNGWGNGRGHAINFTAHNTASADVVYFNTSAATVGSISITSTATAYNTSSDYRLKENIVPVIDGIIRLQQLKPSRFNFLADPSKVVDGFIAHEVQSVVPEAVTGTKDEIGTDGNPKYQGIDQSKLVPLLTAALQEAVAKIESLEARLTAAGI